jgi:hypothetical protein
MRSFYKRDTNFTAWDMNAGCRWCINQSTKSKRKLKKRLRRIARKKFAKLLDRYNEI